MQITKLTKRLLSSPALSLIISLVLAALTLFGITSSVMAARVLLGLAVLIGVLGIMLSEWISLKPWRHVLGVGILAFVILGLLAWRLDVWAVGKAKMDAATLPPPAAPPPPVPPTIAFVKPESKTAKGLIVTGNTNTTGNTVTQGAGSIAQIGGSNNQATITNNWAPPERILNPQDRNELVTQLSKRKARAAVRCVFSDKEACDFAGQLYDVLIDAGWQMIDDIVRPVMGGKFPPGVSVGFHGPVPTENEIQIPNDSLEASVQDALLLAHVKGVYFDREPTVAENTIEFIVAANPQSGPNP